MGSEPVSTPFQLLAVPRSILIIPALCLALAADSAAQTLPFTHYTADSEINPLPSAEVALIADFEAVLVRSLATPAMP